VLPDGPVGRVFERLLRERGYDVIRAKDRCGERTTGTGLLESCAESSTVPVRNDAREFEPPHREYDHAAVFLCLYRDQKLPDGTPGRTRRARAGHPGPLLRGAAGNGETPPVWPAPDADVGSQPARARYTSARGRPEP